LYEFLEDIHHVAGSASEAQHRRTMAGLVGTQQVLLQRFQWAARPTEACAHAGAPQPVQNNSAPEDSKAGASMGGAFPAAGGLMKAVDDAPAEASSAQV